MKKRLTKLLLMAVGLLLGVSAMAQKDVTTQYITNATLASLDGWTKVNAFGSTVQGNNTAGYATEAYAGWDNLNLTSFSLTQDITLPAGHYTLVCYAFFRQGQDYNTNSGKSLAYLKAGNNQVAIKTLGSITANGYANSQAEGANVFDSKMYRNTLDFTLSSQQTINIGVTGTFDEKRSWCIVGQFELIDKDQIATLDSPFDVTGYMVNPGFEYRDMSGWTMSPASSFGTQGNEQTFKTGGFYAEKWQSSGAGALSERSFSQTVTGMPAGLYKLVANVGGNGTYIKLNDKTVNGSAETADIEAYSVIEAGQNLVITAGKTAAGSANWIHFDKFRLYFCGDVTATLASLQAQAQSLMTILPSSADAKQTLQTALQNAGSASSADEYLQAINDLSAAITSYKAGLSSLKIYLYNVGAGKFLTSGNWWGTHAAVDDDGMPITASLDGDMNMTLSTASAFSGKFVEGVWMDAANATKWAVTRVDGTDYFTLQDGNNKLYYESENNVESSATATGNATYWKAMTKDDLMARMGEATTESPIDATFFMTNGKVRRNWSKYIEGTEVTDNGSFNANAKGLYNGGCSSYGQYRKTFDTYQSLTGVPNGIYTVSVKGHYRANPDFAVPYLYANNQKADLKVMGTLSEDNATGATKSLVDDTYLVDPITVIVTDGNLKVGVKSDANVDWCTWREFTIKYLGNSVTASFINSFNIPEGAMNKDVQTALNTAKSTAVSTPSLETAAALLDAINAANASIAAYANAAQYLPVNKAELAGTNFYDADVYKTKITDAEAALAAGTMTDADANSITDIRVGYHLSNYIDDILMSAWTEGPEQWTSLCINTWSNEGDTDGSDFKAPFYQYWTGDDGSLAAKTMTATVSGLAQGDYAVTAWVRVRAKNGATAKPYGISMKANEGEAVEISGTQIGTSQFYLEKYAAVGTVGSDGKLTLTFEVATDNNVSWLSFKDVSYMEGTASLAAFKQTDEPILLSLAGKEAILAKDGITYIQDATAGLAVKGYDIAITDDNQLLSGQLYGTVSGDTIVVEDNILNKVTVSEGKAEERNATAAEAASKDNAFRLLRLNMAEITETGGVYYAKIGNDEVKIDNRLSGENLVLNAGDLVNTLVGVTFLAEDGNTCVLAPRSQDDVVPLLWRSVADGGDDISGANAISLTGEEYMARMANLKAGDVLYVEMADAAAGSLNVSSAAGENFFAIPVGGTTVEIPVTGDMEEEIQNHGLVIESSSSDIKAKYVTVFNGKYYATDNLENTIWLSEGTAATLGNFHFKDVRKGDLFTSDGTMTAEGGVAITSATALTQEQATALLDHTMDVNGKSVVFAQGDDPRDDTSKTEAGESYAQGQTILPTDAKAVDGLMMTYGGTDAEGAQYVYQQVYPEVNKFATVTEGIGQVPVDAAGKVYNKDEKNVPTKGTFYVFEPTKDGQLEVTVGVEKGKTLFVTEDGEAIVEQKESADFEGPVTFPVKATKTYYVFAPETNVKLFGYKFIPADANDANTAKDIATFKLLKEAEAGKTDKLLLNDAVVTYIKGDNVFVEDASGAIDFFETQMQFYVGQKLNGYIYGKNSKLDNMPVLLRTGATPDSKFTVEKGTAQSKVAPIAEVKNEEGLARFVTLKNLELTKDKYGLRILIDEAGDTISLEDRFNVLYELSDLYETIEGIVGIDEEGKIAIWPTSKEGIVVSDGYKRVQETELDVTNKDVAKTKNNPVVGISITLDGACNAGSGSAQAGAMTSKGYKLRTANGSPVANSATFTVNEGKKVYGMVINGVGNYKAKDESLPFIKVTKVEVDGNEVNFEGGEFPAKGASDCGTLTLKNINATKSIVLYFDNSNAEGTQVNIAYAVTYNGEKIYTQKELALIDEAKELAKNRDAIAVGCLDDAIEAAEAGNTEGLQAAIDQFKEDNATSSVDFTNKVGTAVENWVNVQEGEDFKVYTGNGVNLVQVFGVTGAGNVLTQQISGLENGTYNIGMYATSHNAWDGKYGANKAGKPTLQEDANDVAYVFGTSGSSSVNTWITARRNSGLIAGEPELYQVNGVKVADGKLTIGLSLAQAAKTEWHSVQIASLRMVTTAKEAYAAEKANLQAAIDDAEALLAGDQIGGKAKLQNAVDAANEALVSIRLNVPGMANEVAKLRKAIEKFNDAGKVFVQNVATGKYLGAGASWGTHAVLNDTGLDYALTTNSDGTKNFDSQVSNGGAKNFLNGEWNDGEAFGWTVSQLSNGNYTISNGSQYLSAGNDNLVVLSDNADEWRFITVGERKEAMAAATSSAPVDATFLIKGANFNRNDKRNDNWTVSDDCTNRNLSDGNNENNCAESYHSTFTISQVVEDVPAGTYTLTIQGFCRQDGGAAEDAPVFFANEETKAFGPLTGTENSMTDASVSFTSGLYTMEPITVVVAEDGTLTVGVKGTGTSQWVIWDNFQLKYYGNGGTPTAISETVAEPVRFEDGAIYNLRGQKMTGTLKPGLYIKNGKKIVIK